MSDRQITIPIDEWFSRTVDNNVIQLLTEEKTLSRDFFNKDKIIKIIKNHSQGKSNDGRLIWALLNFGIEFSLRAKIIIKAIKKSGPTRI